MKLRKNVVFSIVLLTLAVAMASPLMHSYASSNQDGNGDSHIGRAADGYEAGWFASGTVSAAQDFIIPSVYAQSEEEEGNCDPSYPDVCIAPAPPDLNCGDIPYKDVKVEGDDPHQLDREGDGVACES
jgi:hypothetical protein